ncbi:LOW QUALITY PROTEIN: PEST proteolytic signal-containing nuclear protein-like [Acropora millepora]|uniref:LOW QUALITY PROTEIN: PEST proteolytic signal-containing nuclear protein-like n=1 Tax=Acropora millepora TaxID=45264 RepID=UPI001CF13850|nr:LOW QUALITY PROTEIN: PEST proteolytic signal-containing nuclear protein-like [Acropora millepora]
MADNSVEARPTKCEENREKEGSTSQKYVSVGEKRKLPVNSDTSTSSDADQEPKVAISLSGTVQKKPIGVTMKLGSDPKKQKKEPGLLLKKGTVASIFNDESDEEEEMPAEAKMRMRNVGRNTPTSAGPNSFNKGSKGFSDHRASERSFKLEHPSKVKIKDTRE